MSLRILRVAVVGLIVVMAVSAEGQFSSVVVNANRSKYTGACPVNVTFTGNINYSAPHPHVFTYSYQWVRSDRAKGPRTNVRVEPKTSNRLIVRDSWQIGRSGDYSETLLADSGNTHMKQPSATTVHIVCK
jgi:hypothetical protein